MSMEILKQWRETAERLSGENSKLRGELEKVKGELAEARNDTVRMLAVANGCLDYGGGYRGDDGLMRAFHHGIHTVINALTHFVTDRESTQIRALERIGRNAIAKAMEKA